MNEMRFMRYVMGYIAHLMSFGSSEQVRSSSLKVSHNHAQFDLLSVMGRVSRAYKHTSTYDVTCNMYSPRATRLRHVSCSTCRRHML